ncbi:hypothetical protein Acr_02g0008910 [Actinidia rufa]|uniref:Uncharacterized protein n=1 Tax=Actinidia rufa TaxID=165716 RepID=A0A7J0E835_9ERIC|nr:hypothetical protein Acr_02g0008910 [Actinidia rufa]
MVLQGVYWCIGPIQNEVRWCHPPEDVYKMNVDGSNDLGTGPLRLGVFVRDCSGQPVVASKENVTHVTHPNVSANHNAGNVQQRCQLDDGEVDEPCVTDGGIRCDPSVVDVLLPDGGAILASEEEEEESEGQSDSESGDKNYSGLRNSSSSSDDDVGYEPEGQDLVGRNEGQEQNHMGDDEGEHQSVGMTDLGDLGNDTVDANDSSDDNYNLANLSDCEKMNVYPEFVEKSDMKNPKLQVGMIFSNVVVFRTFLRELKKVVGSSLLRMSPVKSL